jgi:tetratricopeptide (TPR) repeat protein
MYAVNKNAFVGFKEFIKQDVWQLLIKAGFEDQDIFFSLLNQLAEDLDTFSRIDIQAGNWVLQQNRITPKDVLKRFTSEIHLAVMEDVIRKEVVFPSWLEEPEYQKYILQAVPVIEKVLNSLEAVEDHIQAFPQNNQNIAVILSNEWELKQNIKFLRIIIQKGVPQALPEILEIMQTEKNPLGWMIGGFNQRIDDKIDEAAASEPEEAVRILKSAFRLKPKTVQACSLYYNQAMNYENLEKWEEAVEAYKKMNEVAPPNGVGLLYRAKILHQLGRDAEAKNDLEQALALPPLHIYVLDQLQRKEAQDLLLELS